jgi:hypothetical protein
MSSVQPCFGIGSASYHTQVYSYLYFFKPVIHSDAQFIAFNLASVITTQDCEDSQLRGEHFSDGLVALY